MLKGLITSLPIQLIFHHLKKNLALLMLWVIIIGAFSGKIGKVYGIQYLFLDPEYLGSVGFWSFFLVGFCFGIFVISFHITTYILDSHKFRFIGALERPFAKFTLNNSVIPLFTFIYYLILIIQFQTNNQYAKLIDIILYLFGFILGLFGVYLVMMVYFKLTNKDIFKILSGSVDKKLRQNQLSRQRVMNRFIEYKADKYPVDTYLDLRLKLKPTNKSVNFRNKEAILKVFDQNHFNSVVVQLIFISIIVLLSFFMDSQYLQIPAAASCLLILSISMMVAGAISYWFKAWGLSFALGVFILLNFIVDTGYIKGINQATGLNYKAEEIPYSVKDLLRTHSKQKYEDDRDHLLKTLEKWRVKHGDSSKKKMVFLCVSGGGQRAALWTTNALSTIDEQLNYNLMDQTLLITGASGGMIGAAYYREIDQLRKVSSYQIDHKQLLNKMGKDNLNPIIFSLLVNDLFLKMQSYTYEGKKYKKDRGYMFEQNLNKNLDHILDKKVMDYYELEANAKTPILLMSPTISNDGRKLYISSQPISFMTRNLESSNKVRGADFMTYFKPNDSEDLSFLSALRMSASFPYITPNISLPSKPRIEIMDAGISDNFGITDAIRFIYVFKEWISQNTDGVLLLVIRDTKSNAPVQTQPNASILDRITYPIASVYNNLATMQDIKNDARIEHMQEWLHTTMDIVEIAYDSSSPQIQGEKKERASLSWHLTTKEKNNLAQNINIESNRNAIEKVKKILSQ